MNESRNGMNGSRTLIEFLAPVGNGVAGAAGITCGGSRTNCCDISRGSTCAAGAYITLCWRNGLLFST